MDLDFEARFRAVIAKIQTTGDDYADKKSASWYSQKMCSSIKSSIQLKAMNADPKLSNARAEIIAEASEDYIKHLEETREKIRAEHLASSAYEVANAAFEGNRSLCSLEKKTRNLIDGD